MTPEKYARYTSLLNDLINNADSKGEYTWLGDEGFSVKAIQKLHDSLVLDPFRFALNGRPTRKIASATGYFNNLNGSEDPTKWEGAHDLWNGSTATNKGTIPYVFEGVSSVNQQKFLLACREWEAFYNGPKNLDSIWPIL